MSTKAVAHSTYWPYPETMMHTIKLGPTLTLPLDELDFLFVRSSGPGGQHINRSNTKVELRWDLAHSPTLSETQRALLLERLGSYISNDGILRLTSDNTRSQFRNRAAVIRRLQMLVEQALRPRQIRRLTRPSAGYHRHRLKQKKQHSEKKSQRKKINPRDY